MKIELAGRNEASAEDNDTSGDFAKVSSIKQPSGEDESWFTGFPSLFIAPPDDQEERHDGPLPDSIDVAQDRDCPPSPSQSAFERTMDFLNVDWSGSEKKQEPSLENLDSSNQENPSPPDQTSPQAPTDDVVTDILKEVDDEDSSEYVVHRRKKDDNENATAKDPIVGYTPVEIVLAEPFAKRKIWFRKGNLLSEETSVVVEELRDENGLLERNVEIDESKPNVVPKEVVTMDKLSVDESEFQDQNEEMTLQTIEKSSTERPKDQEGIIRTASQAFDGFASKCTFIPTRSEEDNLVAKTIDVIAFPEEYCLGGAASDDEKELQDTGTLDASDEPDGNEPDMLDVVCEGRDRVALEDFEVGKPSLRCDNSLPLVDECVSSDESQSGTEGGTKSVSTIPVILVNPNPRRKKSRFSIFGRKSRGKSSSKKSGRKGRSTSRSKSLDGGRRKRK